MTGHCPWCGDAFELRGVRLQFCGRPGCRQGWRKHTLGRYSGARNQAIANGTWSSWREWHQPFTPMVCVQTGIADTTEALAQYATEHRTECARAGCKGCAQAVAAAPPAAVPVAPVAPAAKFLAGRSTTAVDCRDSTETEVACNVARAVLDLHVCMVITAHTNFSK